jgi:hypothetical protein
MNRAAAAALRKYVKGGNEMKRRMIGAALAACLVCATGARGLEVVLEQDPNSIDIPPNYWTACEAARDLWARRLGFDNCYVGDTVYVRLRMTDAQSRPAWPFMFTSALPETFAGSRRLKPGGATAIMFKDRAFVFKGEDYKWNEDAPWFVDPDPLAGALWSSCDLQNGPCKADGMQGTIFDFYAHMLHEFGHVFGFVGEYFEPFIDSAESGLYFRANGGDGDSVSFKLTSAADRSHANTSVMVVGFSSWERALPNREEIQALQAVFGYGGTRLYRGQAAIGPGRTVEAGFIIDRDGPVVALEVCHWYSSGGFHGAAHVDAVLISPAGTEIRLGPVGPGWTRDGFVRPDLAGMLASRNPAEPLAAVRGESAEGLWKIRYVNEGDQPLELDTIILRMTTEETTSAIPPARRGRLAPGVRDHAVTRGMAYDPRGRELAGARRLSETAFVPVIGSSPAAGHAGARLFITGR